LPDSSSNGSSNPEAPLFNKGVKEASAQQLPMPPSGIYHSLDLPESIKTFYRAAGVLCYARRTLWGCTGEVVPVTALLLGQQEVNGATEKWGGRRFCWADFGGKREARDVSPEATAKRELSEETSNVFDGAQLHRLCVWNRTSKYVMYFGEVTLPAAMPPPNDEIKEFRWLERAQLVHSLRTGKSLFGVDLNYRVRAALTPHRHIEILRTL
tara:strand:- start:1762 stop:2394 length:633 start_codon:yes stop_codon:yes gene_type:complete